MIKFLRDRVILDHEDKPRETFKKGSTLDDPATEYAHVRRGYAAFVRDGKLFDHEGNEVTEAKPKRPRPAPRTTPKVPRRTRVRKGKAKGGAKPAAKPATTGKAKPVGKK